NDGNGVASRGVGLGGREQIDREAEVGAEVGPERVECFRDLDDAQTQRCSPVRSGAPIAEAPIRSEDHGLELREFPRQHKWRWRYALHPFEAARTGVSRSETALFFWSSVTPPFACPLSLQALAVSRHQERFVREEVADSRGVFLAFEGANPHETAS